MRLWEVEKKVISIISFFAWFITMWFTQKREDEIWMKYLRSLDDEDAERFESTLHNFITRRAFDAVESISETLPEDELAQWIVDFQMLVIEDAADQFLREYHPRLIEEYDRVWRRPAPNPAPSPAP